MTNVNNRHIKTALEVIMGVAEAIRAAGEVPSGYLYAQMIGVLDLPGYERVIGILTRAGLVEKRGHLLRWVGPKKEGA